MAKDTGNWRPMPQAQGDELLPEPTWSRHATGDLSQQDRIKRNWRSWRQWCSRRIQRLRCGGSDLDIDLHGVLLEDKLRTPVLVCSVVIPAASEKQRNCQLLHLASRRPRIFEAQIIESGQASVPSAQPDAC